MLTLPGGRYASPKKCSTPSTDHNGLNTLTGVNGAVCTFIHLQQEDTVFFTHDIT